MKAAPRRLVVWRHGETTYNATGKWQGQLDAPLSERGREQTVEAAKSLAAYDVSQLVASDLSRATDTAQALADEAGLSVVRDARFREINVGDWAGLTRSEIRETQGELLDRINAGEDLRRGKTGETVAEVAERVMGGVHELLEGLPPGETAVVATHGFAARTLCAALTGIPQQIAFHALHGMSNCHWAELFEQRDSWHIAGWNLSR